MEGETINTDALIKHYGTNRQTIERVAAGMSERGIPLEHIRAIFDLRQATTEYVPENEAIQSQLREHSGTYDALLDLTAAVYEVEGDLPDDVLDSLLERVRESLSEEDMYHWGKVTHAIKKVASEYKEKGQGLFEEGE